jgi:3-hydroxyacyl-[acyl-carrier-protein] dehydratase
MRFIMVDEILELDPGRSIRAVKTMQPGEEIFKDHFPGFPVVPGVLLTEMMAQAAGKCLAAEDAGRGRPMLAGITSASFRAWVKPGQAVVILATVKSSRPQVATVECSVEVEGRRVAESALMFAFVPADRFAPDYRDEVLETFLERTAGTVKSAASRA